MIGTGIFRTLSISSAGLSVQRMRLDVIAENLANVETTRTEEGGPYRRKEVTITAVKDKPAGGSLAAGNFNDIFARRIGIEIDQRSSANASRRPEGEITRDETTPLTLKYDPGHPDADEKGIVSMPNVNVIDEMVDMITATRAYEANVTAIQAAKDMFNNAIDI
ncbi:MAG: flagellar basal body rod protein FlgC [Candidatus Krumholzibacteriota bacterium]|nr:flagellar basal body rod protein FlgC [Candidatus Krumholzibacteriota bacterium]